MAWAEKFIYQSEGEEKGERQHQLRKRRGGEKERKKLPPPKTTTTTTTAKQRRVTPATATTVTTKGVMKSQQRNLLLVANFESIPSNAMFFETAGLTLVSDSVPHPPVTASRSLLIEPQFVLKKRS